MAEIDWSDIRSEFDDFRELISDIRLLGDDEFQQYRRSILTYGLIKAPEWLKVDYGAALYIHPESDSSIWEIWRSIATELRLPMSTDLELPRHIRSGAGFQSDHITILAEAIETEQVSSEFLRSWARINQLRGQLRVLLSLPNATGQLTAQAIAGLEYNTDVQRCWYAHWIIRHAPSLAPRDRADAAFGLADLCCSIKNGEIEPWRPYPSSWFARVLNAAGDDVSGPLEKLGEPALRKLADDPHYTPRVLPPLSADMFRRTR